MSISKFTSIVRKLTLLLVLSVCALNVNAQPKPANVVSHKLLAAITKSLMRALNKANGADLRKIVNASGDIVNGFTQAKNSLETIETQMKADALLVQKWRASTDPPVPNVYELAIKGQKLKIAGLKAKKTIFLDPSEKDNFNNIAADTNTKKVILTYLKEPLLSGTGMCSETTFSKKVPGNYSYADLKDSSCNTIHNAIAYKKEVTDLHLEILDSIKDATTAVMAVPELPIPTVGRHNAKKAVLLELEALQKEEHDDYNLRIKNADVQIAMANDMMAYAAGSIAEGPPPSALATTTMAAIKLGISAGVAAAVINNVPYNK